MIDFRIKSKKRKRRQRTKHTALKTWLR